MKGLQFNSLSSNLLATGAADGELCIWDLSNPSQPALYPSLKGGSASGNGGSGAGEVRCSSRGTQEARRSTAQGSCTGASTRVGSPRSAQVTYLAWNCKVQHILASTSVKGTTIVWDLKRQKPVISFTDPNRHASGRMRSCS